MEEARCKVCEKKFGSEDSMNQHKRDAHAKGDYRHNKAAVKKYGVMAVLLVLISASVVYVSTPVIPNLNKPAPDFALQSTAGDMVSLSGFRGKNVLLFFSEGLGCDPCWQQLRDMQNEISEFQALDTEILTIVVNPPGPSAVEARKWGISLPVLIDSGLSVSKSYDALKYSMHPGQVPGHSFVFIDKGGVVKWRWDWGGGSMYVPVGEIINNLKSL